MIKKSVKAIATMIIVGAICFTIFPCQAMAMQIFVKTESEKTVSGKTVTIDVEPTDKIEYIKKEISIREGCPPETQILLFGGKILENHRTVSDCGLQKESTIQLLINPIKAMMLGTVGGNFDDNVDVTNVLFISSVVGGKSVGINTSLTEVSEGNPTDWKMTKKDSSHTLAKVETTSQLTAGETISVNYAGASTSNTLSAMVIDRITTEIMYYGNISSTTLANGKVNITLPGDYDNSKYKLVMFTETLNGDNETDFASEMVEVVVTDSVEDKVVVEVDNSDWKPTSDDLYRSSFKCSMPPIYEASKVSYDFKLVNEIQGPLCHNVFNAFRGEYQIGTTYSAFKNNALVHELGEFITVTLEIPILLQKENRSYEMICVHKDGNAIVLSDLDLDPNTITFTMDKCYAFALCYLDN